MPSRDSPPLPNPLRPILGGEGAILPCESAVLPSPSAEQGPAKHGRGAGGGGRTCLRSRSYFLASPNPGAVTHSADISLFLLAPDFGSAFGDAAGGETFASGIGTCPHSFVFDRPTLPLGPLLIFRLNVAQHVVWPTGRSGCAGGSNPIPRLLHPMCHVTSMPPDGRNPTVPPRRNASGRVAALRRFPASLRDDLALNRACRPLPNSPGEAP
jgi:hypothetical protein